MDCIFCQIIQKQIPSDIIYEDGQVIAFMNIKPISRGHCLVVPKKHAKDMLESDPADLSAIISAVQKVAKAVMQVTGAPGFNLGVNTGAVAGQIIFHTHFHIIPRFGSDGLKDWPHTDSEPQTRAELAEKIKQQIA